jgi:hypothetical protein
MFLISNTFAKKIDINNILNPFTENIGKNIEKNIKKKIDKNSNNLNNKKVIIKLETIFNNKILINNRWFKNGENINQRYKIVNISSFQTILFDSELQNKITLDIYRNNTL